MDSLHKSLASRSIFIFPNRTSPIDLHWMDGSSVNGLNDNSSASDAIQSPHSHWKLSTDPTCATVTIFDGSPKWIWEFALLLRSFVSRWLNSLLSFLKFMASAIGAFQNPARQFIGPPTVVVLLLVEAKDRRVRRSDRTSSSADKGQHCSVNWKGGRLGTANQRASGDSEDRRTAMVTVDKSRGRRGILLGRLFHGKPLSKAAEPLQSNLWLRHHHRSEEEWRAAVVQYRPPEETDGVKERKSNFWKVFPLLRAIGNLEAKWNAALDSLLVCEIFNFNSIPFGVDSFIAAPPPLCKGMQRRDANWNPYQMRRTRVNLIAFSTIRRAKRHFYCPQFRSIAAAKVSLDKLQE